MENNSQVVLRTIVYSSMFRYPLSQSEIWRYVLSSHKFTKKNVADSLSALSFLLVRRRGWYAPRDQAITLQIRAERQKESKKKVYQAKKLIRFLGKIPTVKLIGISGSVAMLNAEPEDDIDLFIIAARGTLWISRLCLLSILQMKGLRRKRTSRKKTANKICLNMLIDESALHLPLNRQDMYSAHEVVQLLPLFDRDDTYKKFIKANSWVTFWMPNCLKIRRKKMVHKMSTKLSKSATFLLRLFEVGAKILQKRYMRPHVTRETITKNILAFHPLDYREFISQVLQTKLKAYRKFETEKQIEKTV